MGGFNPGDAGALLFNDGFHKPGRRFRIDIAVLSAIDDNDFFGFLPGLTNLADQLPLQFRNVLMQAGRGVQDLGRIQQAIRLQVGQFKTHGPAGYNGNIGKGDMIHNSLQLWL